MCEDLGLAWADHFTILGIDIDNKLQRLDDNFNRINKKVRGIINVATFTIYIRWEDTGLYKNNTTSTNSNPTRLFYQPW